MSAMLSAKEIYKAGKTTRVALGAGTLSLRNDRTSGARVLAIHALEILKDVVEERQLCESQDYFWAVLTFSGRAIIEARPSMAAAIASAVLHALHSIRESWPTDPWTHIASPDSSLDLLDDHIHRRQIALEVLDQQIKALKASNANLAASFTPWIKVAAQEFRKQPDEPLALRVLTLSYSSSVLECLRECIKRSPGIYFSILVLESRPGFEGAVFARTLSKDLDADSHTHTRIEVGIDSHVAAFASQVDIVLLGADRISGEGDVSNKIGSLAAVLCAKQLSPRAVVTVVSETGKIAKHGAMSAHAVEENDSREVEKCWPDDVHTISSNQNHNGKGKDFVTRNLYFEWVPARYVDYYVCERGFISLGTIATISRQIEAVEKEVFKNDSPL